MINISQKIFITNAIYFFRSSKVHSKRSSVSMTATICQSGCPHQSICIRLYNYIRTKPCDDFMITQATKPQRCCPQAVQQIKQKPTEITQGSLHKYFCPRNKLTMEIVGRFMHFFSLHTKITMWFSLYYF